MRLQEYTQEAKVKKINKSRMERDKPRISVKRIIGSDEKR